MAYSLCLYFLDGNEDESGNEHEDRDGGENGSGNEDENII